MRLSFYLVNYSSVRIKNQLCVAEEVVHVGSTLKCHTRISPVVVRNRKEQQILSVFESAYSLD